jgi:hypothetical protein
VYIPKRLLLPVLVVALLASSLVFALGASANRDPAGVSATFLSSPLAPSLPTDPTIHGVAPGGAPWALTAGSVVLHDNGRLQVRIRGLVLTVPPFVGKPGPVTGVAASLYCGADATTTAAVTTGVERLSDRGNALINTTVTLPSSCLAPIVLVHPVIASTLNTSIYIAVTGFMR